MADKLSSDHPPNQRRQFLQYFASVGLSSSLLPGVLWAKLHQQKAQKITREMLRDAEEIAGLHFTDTEREMMLSGVNQNRDIYKELRQVHLDPSIAPALRFSPILPGMRFDTVKLPFRMSSIGALKRPADIESVAFWPVTHLSALIRYRQLASLELTELYLDRLKRFDPVLKCVVTLTDDLALKQANQADAESRQAATADTAWNPVGREGSHCKKRISNDVGRAAFQKPDFSDGCDSSRTPGQGRGRPCGEARNNAIHGPDGMDLTVVDLPFNWDATLDVRRLRVGYLKKAFHQQQPVPEEQVNDEATLEVLRSLGACPRIHLCFC